MEYTIISISHEGGLVLAFTAVSVLCGMLLYECRNVFSHIVDLFFFPKAKKPPVHSGLRHVDENAPNLLCRSAFQSFPKNRERQPCTTGAVRAGTFLFQQHTTPGGCAHYFLLSGLSSRDHWNLLVRSQVEKKCLLCALISSRLLFKSRLSDI